MVTTVAPYRPINRYLKSFQAPRPPATEVWGTAGRVLMVQIDIPYTLEVDRIIYHVGVAQLGDVRAAIYAEGGADIPDEGALMVESASVAQDQANRIQMITIAETLLPAGQYWLAIQGSNVGGTIFMSLGGTSATEVARARYDLGAYGAFTDPCPATVQDGTCRWPRMVVRVVV